MIHITEMELRHLKAFVALAEDMHFGRAAARLGVAQPALSLQIKALEASLGALLFERSRRHVALTESGRSFLPEAKATLDQADRARRAAMRAARGETGRLEIAFTGSTPFTNLIPRVFGRFRRTWPDLRMALREMSTAQQLAALKEGTLDIGFVRPNQPGQDQGIEMHPVLDEPLLAVMASDHPLAGKKIISASELAAEPFIINPRQVGTGLHDKVVELCRNAGFVPQTVIEAHQMPTVVGLAAAGIGVSIVPEAMRHIEVEGACFVPLREADAHLSLLLAHRSDDQRLPVKRFVTVVLGSVAAP